MIPEPARIATIVDDSEEIALRDGFRLKRLPRENRRRLLAEAAFRQLREDDEDDGGSHVVPEPMVLR
jgi:hypothetical protein